MEKVVASFWKGKRVFLTGHTGFKGSWMSLWLAEMGAIVTGYALVPPTDPSLFETARIGELIDSKIGDVRDLESLKSAVVKAQPEIILHMAAQPLVRYSFAHPVETYMTNVMGTVHMFEAARAAGSVKAIVNVTTDKCYENQEWHWGYREDEPMGGYDPYSSSKGCSELVTAAYRQSFFGTKNKSSLNVASARAGNVIGGGDWAEDRLIPDIMKSMAAGSPVKIRNPRSIRPWQHVMEPLSGYLVLAQKLYTEGEKYAQAFNFGPQDEDAKQVEWIAQRLTQKWGAGAKYEILDQTPNLHEATYLKLDCSKAKAVLGWTPKWDLEKALSTIVEWNLEFTASKQQARAITLKQIHDYAQ